MHIFYEILCTMHDRQYEFFRTLLFDFLQSFETMEHRAIMNHAYDRFEIYIVEQYKRYEIKSDNV